MTTNQKRAIRLAQCLFDGRLSAQQLSEDDWLLLILAAGRHVLEHPPDRNCFTGARGCASSRRLLWGPRLAETDSIISRSSWTTGGPTAAPPLAVLLRLFLSFVLLVCTLTSNPHVMAEPSESYMAHTGAGIARVSSRGIAQSQIG